MQPHRLIDKYYAEYKTAREILLRHSSQVAHLAKSIAEKVRFPSVDIPFVEEAAWLHDIGMLYTDVPEFGCTGSAPYLRHGLLGAQLLREEGLPRHALVCERHIGVGLSVNDIRTQRLPLPMRDMQPETIEEQIVAYADLFFSKTRTCQKTVEEVCQSLARHGDEKVALFNKWHTQFGR